MEVKSAFKQREVGKVPEGWEVVDVGSKCDFLTGFPFQSSGFTRSGIRLLRGSNVKRGTLDWSDDISQYWPQTTQTLRQYILSIGDVVIAMDGALVGRSYATITRDDTPALLVQRVARLRSDKFDIRLLGAWICSEKFAKHVDTVKTHTAIPHISPKDIREFRFLLPTDPHEQRAIANALSDVDELIAAQERLIAKKQDIKQAVMQQLLTGQIRLPGFSGDWVTKPLGELAHIKTGSRNNEDKVEGGLYPFFVRSDHIERINSYSHECEAILVPGEGRIGSIYHYIDGRFDVHQRVYAIMQFDRNVSGKFVHLYMSMFFGEWALQNTVKATVDSLRLPTFQLFSINMPSTRDEQLCIAQVLTDLETEILALEKRLAKSRDVKQGMMQQLLTGEVRFI